jgi:LPS O-antigen subunit length determinant protein (WzzB/FepE family)
MTDPIQAQPNKHEHEIDLIEIIHILWKARKFIAIVTAN